jgi:hypothetical protein
MPNSYYVRNLEKTQKWLGIQSSEFASILGISLTTLRHLKGGRPVTAKIAQRVKRRIKRRDWSNLISFEQPTYELKLKLNPKAVRFTRYNRCFRVRLISATTLTQAINGRTFTQTFAKRLRSFLRWIPLSQDEFTIGPAMQSIKRRPVDEQNTNITPLESGDELTDLVVTLREQFRCHFEHSAVFDKKYKAMKKTGSVDINEIRIPTTSIRALGVLEQNLLIAFGLAHNELAFLARLATIGGHQTRKGRIFDAFSLSQQLTILKLFAGKIHECWNLVRLRYFNTHLSKTFNGRISADSKNNLKYLKKYFNKPGNAISLIRNEAAFHYSRTNVHESLDHIAGSLGCITYLSGNRYYNELYDFCEMAMSAHLLDQINQNRSRAVATVEEEIGEVGSNLSHFLKDILFIVLQDAAAIEPKQVKIIVRKFGLDRKKNNTAIPIFINLNDYYNEATKLRRLLK